LSLTLVFLLIAGCATLPLPRLIAQPARTPPTDILDDGYEDYVGVIHVHTTYSHDAHGTFESVVRTANAQGLDYVIVTDHNTLQPLRDGLQGWHGATLVLIGTELSIRGGHLLALDIAEEIDRGALTTQQVIDEVNRQGGLGIIAHPYFEKRRWTDWSVDGLTGVEAYNVAHDTMDEHRFRMVLWTLATTAIDFYYSILDRPYDPLAKWDELITQHGRMLGIGSTDAHEFHVFGVKFAPYQIMFQLSRTHLLVPSTTLTPEAVYDALRQGHAYFSLELVTEAKEFTFFAEREGRVVALMGDAVELQPEMSLTIAAPAVADLRLLWNGKPMAATTAQTWNVPLAMPGVYRVEAFRHEKPWIFSNPIYVRPQLERDADAP